MGMCWLPENGGKDISNVFAVGYLAKRSTFAHRLPKMPEIRTPLAALTGSGVNALGRWLADLTDFGKALENLLACGCDFVSIKNTSQKEIAVGS
jgi:hypothetical protein